MTKKLIVNADGFGFGPGATQGILDALEEGKFITSVSVNANFPEAERIREVVERFPKVSIGVHLNPMVGRPCLPPASVPSLVGSDGCLQGQTFIRRLKKGLVSMIELEREFDAQIAAVKDLAGDRLTHLDSQANSHLDYFDLFLSLALKWNIRCMRNNASLICMEAADPLRSRLSAYLRRPHVCAAHGYRRYQMQKARRSGLCMADALITVGYAGTGNKTDPENWRRILRNIPEGTFEVYCHPAYPDQTLQQWAVYCEERKSELQILRGAWLPAEAAAAGVELINFHDIQRHE
jgi:predicted glycoside hydrolase/deacetylase ChbG (UPF0249 family)